MHSGFGKSNDLRESNNPKIIDMNDEDFIGVNTPEFINIIPREK